jgi:hypothetical protein
MADKYQHLIGVKIMSRMYRTAQGKPIDIDNLRLSNESTIAVGNMKVNARGDQLGPGGIVDKSRNQVMDQHYKLHTPMAGSDSQANTQRQIREGSRATQGVIQPATPPTMVPNVDPSGFSFDPEPEQNTQQQLRGSLADSIAKGNQ